MPTYHPAPLLYQAHHDRHLEDIPFWLGLAQRFGAPVLELGCGTGRVTLPLAAAGYRVCGIDHDRQMLATLQVRKAPSMLKHIWLVQTDLTSFHLALRPRLIILPCNTYSTLSGKQRRSLLERVRQHLSPQGVFAASLPNPVTLRQLPRRTEPQIDEIFPHPLDGEPVQVSSAWRRSADSLEFTWLYDHLHPDGRVERTTVRVQHSLLPPDEYLAEINQAGLELLALYGNYDRSPYHPESPYLIFIAQKAENPASPH